MDIVFVTPHVKVAGGTRILLTYADHLARRGHRVSVVVEEASRMRRYIGICMGRRRLQWIASDFRPRIRYVSRISTEVCVSADVVVASTSRHAIALCSHKGLVHLIQHDDGLYHEPREVADRAYMLPCPKIAVSSWVEEVVRTQNENANITLLLNPIDRTLFSLVEGIRSKAPPVRILLLDHPYPWKGTEEGVRLVERLKKTHPHIKLVLFGTRRSSTPFSCDEYHYNVPQSGLSDLYSSCDVYLCPSWDEGFGLPSLEAMACGVALVTYDNGGSRDYAVDGETAFVAPRKDQEALFQKLLLCVEQKEIRQSVARRGYERVLSMPTWNEQVSKLESLCMQ